MNTRQPQSHPTWKQSAIAVGQDPKLALAVNGIPVPKQYDVIKNRLCVQFVRLSNSTKGGVILPDGATNEFVPAEAVVIATGPDVKTVKVNDHVIIMMGSPGAKVDYNDVMTVVIEEEMVVGIIGPYVPPEEVPAEA